MGWVEFESAVLEPRKRPCRVLSATRAPAGWLLRPQFDAIPVFDGDKVTLMSPYAAWAHWEKIVGR